MGRPCICCNQSIDSIIFGHELVCQLNDETKFASKIGDYVNAGPLANVTCTDNDGNYRWQHLSGEFTSDGDLIIKVPVAVTIAESGYAYIFYQYHETPRQLSNTASSFSIVETGFLSQHEYTFGIRKVNQKGELVWDRELGEYADDTWIRNYFDVNVYQYEGVTINNYRKIKVVDGVIHVGHPMLKNFSIFTTLNEDGQVINQLDNMTMLLFNGSNLDYYRVYLTQGVNDFDFFSDGGIICTSRQQTSRLTRNLVPSVPYSGSYYSEPLLASMFSIDPNLVPYDIQYFWDFRSYEGQQNIRYRGRPILISVTANDEVICRIPPRDYSNQEVQCIKIRTQNKLGSWNYYYTIPDEDTLRIKGTDGVVDGYPNPAPPGDLRYIGSYADARDKVYVSANNTFVSDFVQIAYEYPGTSTTKAVRSTLGAQVSLGDLEAKWMARATLHELEYNNITVPTIPSEYYNMAYNSAINAEYNLFLATSRNNIVNKVDSDNFGVRFCFSPFPNWSVVIPEIHYGTRLRIENLSFRKVATRAPYIIPPDGLTYRRCPFFGAEIEIDETKESLTTKLYDIISNDYVQLSNFAYAPVISNSLVYEGASQNPLYFNDPYPEGNGDYVFEFGDIMVDEISDITVGIYNTFGDVIDSFIASKIFIIRVVNPRLRGYRINATIQNYSPVYTFDSSLYNINETQDQYLNNNMLDNTVRFLCMDAKRHKLLPTLPSLDKTQVQFINLTQEVSYEL